MQTLETMNKFAYNIGDTVMIPPHRFPRGHRPTKGNIYTISDRWHREEDAGDFFDTAGNFYCLSEVPHGTFAESDIEALIQPTIEQPTA